MSDTVNTPEHPHIRTKNDDSGDERKKPVEGTQETSNASLKNSLPEYQVPPDFDLDGYETLALQHLNASLEKYIVAFSDGEVKEQIEKILEFLTVLGDPNPVHTQKDRYALLMWLRPL